MLPTTLRERYSQIRILGRGGMGSVLLCRDRELDRQVAVKIMHDALGASDEDRSRFLREARLAASLRHGNVVEIFEVGEADGHAYLTMEFVRGRSLEALLESGLGLRPGLAVLADVARALAAAHETGILHRDLSPGNVLVPDAGPAKVADWGLARPIRGEGRLTRTGVVLGTPHYMAPEQVKGEVLGPATDLYALGVILYRLVTGRLPFSDERTMQVLLGHLQSPPPPFEAAPALRRLVEELLEKSPDRRLGDAALVARRLDELAADRETTRLSAPRVLDDPARSAKLSPENPRLPPGIGRTPPPASGRSPRRSRGPVAAIFVLLVLLVGAGLHLRRRPPRAEAPVTAAPFVVLPPEVEGTGRLHLRFRGTTPPGPWTLVVRLRSDGTMRLVLDPTRAEQVSQSTRLLTIDTPRRILEPAELVLEGPGGGGLGGPWSIDPAPRLRDELALLFAPLRRKGKAELDESIRELRKLCDAFHGRDEPRGGKAEQLRTFLAKAALAGEDLARLGRELPSYLAGPPTLRGELAERMAPLRALEMAMTYPDCPPPPWGLTGELLGHEWHTLPLRHQERSGLGQRPLSAWIFPDHASFCASLDDGTWRSQGSLNLVRRTEDDLPEWLWMASFDCIARSQATAADIVVSSRAALVAADLGEFRPSTFVAEKEMALPLQPPLPSPEDLDAVRLDLLLRFRPSLALRVEVGEEAPVSVCNDYHLRPEIRGLSQMDPFVISLPLPASVFRRNPLPIRLRIEPFPFETDIDSLAVGMIGLRVRTRR